eukprot:Blabericola_migrator_1__11932@NODE_729_length_6710_cov_177_288876_g525_i0_p1_GENE_NODE_729_length_6710_cov_177_288876_g525_i0NODE_729_length_6710_cov_177_288876_g525_i0_p1_ORF_typecomplete_len902_score168_18MIF4G/PF02854_19/4_8e38Sec15/PF04091_12/19Sec15/PF04091_12/0_47_NODE_729_length_6710_cov_177_288876_g525_i01482853
MMDPSNVVGSGGPSPDVPSYLSEMNQGGLKRTHNSAAEFSGSNRPRGGGGGPHRQYDNYKHRQDFVGNNQYQGNNQDDTGRYSRDHKPPNRGWKNRNYDNAGSYMGGGGGYKTAVGRGGAEMQPYYGRGGHMSRGKRGSSRIPSAQQASLARMNSGESENRVSAGDPETVPPQYMSRYNPQRNYDQASQSSQPAQDNHMQDRQPSIMERSNDSVRRDKISYNNNPYKGGMTVPTPPPPSMFDKPDQMLSSSDTPRGDGSMGSKVSARNQGIIPPPPEQPMKPQNGNKYRQPMEMKSKDGMSPSTPQSPRNKGLRQPYQQQTRVYEPAPEVGGAQYMQLRQPWQAPVATSAPAVRASPASKDAEGGVPQYNPHLKGPDPRSILILIPGVVSMSVGAYAEVVSQRAKRDLLMREAAVKAAPPPPPAEVPPPPPMILEEPCGDQSVSCTKKTQKYSIEFCLSLREDALKYYGKDMTPMKMPTDTTPLGPSHSGGRLGHHRRRSLGSGTNAGGAHHSPIYSNRAVLPEAPWPRSTASTTDAPGSPSSSVLPPTRSNKAQLPREVALRRTVKGLLNKLTVEQFESIATALSNEVQKTQNVQELAIVMEEVHSKSVREPNFSEMYADLVLVLRAKSPVFPSADSDKPDTFQRLLITKCQQEFDQMKDFANLDLPEEERKDMTEEDIETERVKRKTRTLGNMRFIGELNLRRVVVNVALASILAKLIKGDPFPPAHVVECVCELLTTVGYHMDHSDKEGEKGHLNAVFCHLRSFHEQKVYESRIDFKIQDLLELRESDWVSKYATFVDKANTLSNIRDSPSQNNNVHVVGRQSDYPYKAFVRELNEDWLQRRKEQKKKEADARLSPNKPAADLRPPNETAQTSEETREPVDVGQEIAAAPTLQQTASN